LSSEGAYFKSSSAIGFKFKGECLMGLLDKIIRSKIKRLIPQSDIDKLMILAREGNNQQRIQAYLQLSNITVDLLSEPAVMREAYRARIIQCATASINDDDLGIQSAAKLAVAQQLLQVVPHDSSTESELKRVTNLLRDKLTSLKCGTRKHLSQDEEGTINSLIPRLAAGFCVSGRQHTQFSGRA
jgi:hypothetical protein